MSRYKELRLRETQLREEGIRNLAAAQAAGRDLRPVEIATADRIEAELAAVRRDLDREINSLEAERGSAMEIPDYSRLVVGSDRASELGWIPPLPPSASAVDRARARDLGFGSFLQAVYRAADQHVVDPRLQYQAAAQGAGIADGSDGGFLVPTEFVNELALRAAMGDVLSRVRRRSMSGNTVTINVVDETSRATGSRFGGVQSYWVDEGTSITASKPKLARVRLELHKVAALGYATSELMADTGGLFGQLMTDAFSEELCFMAEDAVVEGTGAGQPQGILGAPATVVVAKETGQVTATIVKQNIDKMWARMLARYRASAVWLINQDVEPQLDNMTMVIGTGGVPVYLPPGGLSETPYARLKGRPVIPVEYCPTLGTVGDIILADLGQYLLVEHSLGIQGASSMHVAFVTDEMAFRVTWRIDGQPMQRTALTPFKGSNTLSAFVTLATRS
jgi:HK97 family phage major capsid protein